MKEIFEKIKEKLADQVYMIRDTYALGNDCTEDYIGAFEEIVNQVAEEFTTDTNVGNNDGWIPVSSGKLPEEHESIFARFKGTDKWKDAMFEKTSDEVIVTVEFEDGTRKTMTLHTIDGEWNTKDKIVKFKVIAWQPLPELYHLPEELGEPKPCANTECVYYKEGVDCEAAEGCAGYEPPAEPNWQNHMMNRFMREN